MQTSNPEASSVNKASSGRGKHRSRGAACLGTLLTQACCVLSLAIGGCASLRRDGDAQLSQPAQPAGELVPASGPNAPRSSSRTYRLDAEEMALWRDPAFRKQFTLSYTAETDIEPVGTLTVEEREQMQKVLALMSDDKMDEAARVLEKSRGQAANAVFDFTLGNIHFQRDELDDAVAAYKIAVGKYDRFRRAWRNLGLIHIRRKDYEQAVPALTRVVELGGGDALTYGLLGFAYASSTPENDLAAESAFRMAILLDPLTLDWPMGLARSFFRQQRYAEAAALLGTLIADHPDRADLWLLQANAYVGLSQPLKAAENYELVDRMGKSTPDSLNMLGDIYVNEEVYDLAVRCYIRAIEKDTNGSVQRPLRAARVLAGRGALRETRDLVRRIETLKGDEVTVEERKDLLKLRHRIAVAAGASAEEITVLEESIKLDPLDGEALILLGQHYGRTGDNEKAVFYFERAQAIERYEADALVRHAQLLVKLKNYDKALPLLERAQKLKPRDNIEQYRLAVERAAKNR